MIEPRTLSDLSWPALLREWSQRCRTIRGAEEVLDRPFFDRPAEAQDYMQRVFEARSLAARDAEITFGGIVSIDEAVVRAQSGGLLEPKELFAVATTSEGCGRIRKHLVNHSDTAPMLAARAALMHDHSALFEEVFAAIGPDGSILDEASPTLGGLRRQVTRLKGQLEERARKMVDDQGLSRHLQDRFYTQREDRYVLPVKAGSQHAVKGIVHGTSRAGQTVFVEPEALVSINNNLKLAEAEVFEEERRILRALTDLVSQDAEGLVHSTGIVLELDILAAAARLCDELDASMPRIAERVHLMSARHPLLTLSTRECVPNDIELDARQIMVISGPNAGGKTVALKTTGIAALMVRAGLHVPAEPGSEMPWFVSVETDIGDSQSIDADLSTFSGHILNLNRMLANAGEKTLVLVDEIAAATEPEQGAALAQSMLEALAARGVPAIVTTHYERLKALAAGHDRMMNASVGFDLAKLEPTFRLQIGVAGPSSALDVAKKLGTPGDVLGRAQSLLGEKSMDVQTLLREVADLRGQLDQEHEALLAARREAERAKAAADEAERQFKKREKRVHQDAHDGAIGALRGARQELDRLKSSAVKRRAKGPAKEEVRALQKKVEELAGEVAEHAPEKAPAPGRPATAADLKPGAIVYVLSFGSQGEVTGTPTRKQVEVRVGVLRSMQAISNLRIVDGAAPAPRKKEPSYQATSAPAGDRGPVVRTPDATLDLRGLRADEAIAEAEKFLDRGLLEGREVVFFLHGHGTGALRSAIRELCETSHSVAEWRPGEPPEGGDGITVAWLP